MQTAFLSCFTQLGLQFFPDRLLALKQMVRVLKPGGRAGFNVYSAIERTPVAHAFVQSTNILDQRLQELIVPNIYPAMRRNSALGRNRLCSTLSM